MYIVSVVEKDDQPRKESKDMSLSSVVSVECVKLKKKSRTNKVLVGNKLLTNY